MPQPSTTSNITNALPIHYTLGDYQITAVLAEDNFIITYKAIHSLLKLPVIIKEYLPKVIALRNRNMPHIILKDINMAPLYKKALTQYQQEIENLLTLYHPNITNVRACINANNTTYMVTDFIEGDTLDNHIKRELWSEKDITSLLKPLLDGLQAIHEAGFCHNNITPTNIIIKKDNVTPVITLWQKDPPFQLHHQIESGTSTNDSTHKQSIIHSQQDVQNDIYAMGAVLYYLVSGIMPISLAQRLTAIDEGKPDPLVPAYLISQGRYPETILLAISHAMETQKTNRPKLQDWKKELGIKASLCLVEKDHVVPSPKKLEIDFSEIKPHSLSIKKWSERQQYTTAIAVTAVMLSLLIATVVNYKKPLNKVDGIIKINSDPSFSIGKKTTRTYLNLTTISTIIENSYFHYPERKLYLSKEIKKPHNNTVQALQLKQRKSSSFKTKMIIQTSQSGITKYEK